MEAAYPPGMTEQVHPPLAYGSTRIHNGVAASRSKLAACQGRPRCTVVSMAYPGNTARAVFEFELPNGTKGYVTPHFRSFGGADLSQGDVEDLADLLKSWYTTANFQGQTNSPLGNFPATNLVLQNIEVTGLALVAPPQYVLAVNDAGNAATGALPNADALVVTLYTGIVGRRYRGRNFWPVLVTGMMEADGTLAGATVTALQATFQALIDGLESHGQFVMAVHSEAGLMTNQVISCVVRDVVYHQRRRNH